MARIPRTKLAIIIGIVLLYAAVGIIAKLLVMNGTIPPAAPSAETQEQAASDVQLLNRATEGLGLAEDYVQRRLVRPDGHVRLYAAPSGSTFEPDQRTNSEAMSYYLLWTAQARDKRSFDRALDYIERYMQHEDGYLMWRVEANGSIIDDGANIASDADLRAIAALLIAEQQWNDSRYTGAMGRLAQGLEAVAITHDGFLAPYGGGSAEQPWTANEVWLSYQDFTVTRALAERRGQPWEGVHFLMKNATLGAQIHNGLFNSQLTEQREYGNGIDNGGYGINSLWIMARSAESGDPELQEAARRSLEFYKEKYAVDAQLFGLYSSSGDALSSYDAPWVYALVGRAAIALNDEAFSDEMITKLLEFQVNTTQSALYGAFPEGGQTDVRVGQFTMQESILTLQDYVAYKQAFRPE